MSEYLAPGVYVEEIPSANKPIQAASTSTAGMVGMTERGPTGRPILVTSRGAYARLFGGYLNPLVYRDGGDALPYAAEGFFTNGGARLYVVRVVGPGADEAELRLLARATGVDAAPVLVATAHAGETSLLVDEPGELAPGSRLLIADGMASEEVEFDEADLEERPAIGAGLVHAFPNGSSATLQTATPIAGTLAGELEAGATEIALDDVDGLAEGAVLLLQDASGDLATHEFVTVASVNSDANTVALAASLRRAHAAESTLSSLADSVTVTTLDAPAGPSAVSVFLDLEDATGFEPGSIVRLEAPGDGGDGEEEPDEEYAIITAVPQVVPLADELAHDHARGVALVAVRQVLTVHSRWPGAWGNALRVTVGDSALVETATVGVAPVGASTVTVATAFGLFEGSVIAFTDGPTVEVADLNTTTGVVTLAAPLEVEIAEGTEVTSQEFSLTIERIVEGKAAESEVFDRLSMASEHPRYALKIVGGWDIAIDRPSESGSSQLVRLSDDADAETRVMPLLAGVPRMLSGGNDDVANVTEASYVGEPADDPDRRTGIQALENEPTISIVAVPGQTSVAVQNALLAHCEKLRYRFAVLDVPLGSTLAQARTHRQNFDSTRAAIYYPGLAIPDQFREPGDRRIIPSSGHVLGVYARTDLTRGVHKAPANEVIRGILGLETGLTKGEQDILNPINLNCLRDFRSENRGLRVYGARVATSDPEWKYVNVRRLLLFIEQSLDTGLQWAVFEPNDQPLWDTVKQTITGFLTTVWRSGALEGSKAEEAYFVNIGFNITMTQDDVDNGRLIVEVGVAPVKPAEFVIIRISQKTREATS